MRTSPERDEELRHALNLSTEALAGLKGEVTDLFDRGLVRWPNVFATVAAAREFYGGTFHTHLCHGLETELMDVLNVRFNDHGLIKEWAAAVAASEWINRDEVGAEPVPWHPWRIDDYPLV